MLLRLCPVFGQNKAPYYWITVNGNSTGKKVTNSAPLVPYDITPTITSPPQISYQTPQVYIVGQSNAPLAPANSGGAVPATIYGQTNYYTSNSFNTVTGLVVDAVGNVYVADWGQNQIKKINTSGISSLFAGSFSGSPGSSNGQGTAASFDEPDALVMDNAGNIFVSDQTNNLIRKIAPDGTVSTFAGSGNTAANDGTGTAASFNNPRGMTIDASGNIYVADQGNNLIRKITPAGVVTTYAGNGSSGFSNGPSLSASFNTPTAVGIDAAGNLYVSDAVNGAIRKITTTGVVSTLATGFSFPRELRVDGTGNIYVADQNSGSVKRISPAGIVTTIVTGLSDPRGLTLDGKGNMFVGNGSTVKKVIISGYTIDKPLPAGLTFDPTTGIISGTPTVASPATEYTITAYNGGGSSTTVVNIAVLAADQKRPSIITLPPQQPGMLDPSHNYYPNGTSTNHETPITYTSSNPAVATITADGQIHVLAPGVTIITAYQKGDDNYEDAVPVWQTLTVTEYLAVELPPIPTKTVCDADFSANGFAPETKIPVTYTSSNPAVATVDNAGTIHITGIGTTVITMYQNADPPLYVSATPQSQTLTVTAPVSPVVSISAAYASPCLGSPVTFTATAQNTGAKPNYQWQVNGTNAGTNSSTFTSTTLSDGDKVTCIVTNNDSQCLSTFPGTSNTITVHLITPVNPSVTIAASRDYAHPGETITFTATAKNTVGTVNYQWFVNGVAQAATDSVFSSGTLNNGDVVTCSVSLNRSCSAPATSQPIKVLIVAWVVIPNAFTPNADGVNDNWNIAGITDYPNCKVRVYNRYGVLLYQSVGYANVWNGTFNGQPVPIGTYYYVIDLAFKNTIMSGYVTVIR